MSLARIAHNRRSASADDLDDLFLKHYAGLVARAEHLVGRNRQMAEDLVHDVYVRLALRDLDLSSVHHIEAYLATTLRNVHLSHVRRGQSNASMTVSIVDHESAVAGLQSLTSEEERQNAFDALQHVLHYACLRKGTSTAASVLILRFFHGYYPWEIARLVRATEAAVTERLRMARAEVRSYLADPGRVLRFNKRRTWRSGDVSATDDAASMRKLRQAIFEARTGACVTARAVDCLYSGTDPLGAATLAHLVSCAACLDAVNRRLGLTLQADRDPSDRLGRGGPPDAPGGHGSRPDLTRILRTRLDDIRENCPQEMQIAVNGLFVSAQAINGRMNEHRLKLLVTEQVGFIEIFDEHDICLLYLDIEPPPAGVVEQSARVPLSDGRVLSATVAFADATPTLHVVYDGRLAAIEVPAAPEHVASTGARRVTNWRLWPPALRFAIAGIVVGVLLANPQQTLAAVQHVSRSIVESLAHLLERLRPRAVLPARPATTAMSPLATPAVSDTPFGSRMASTGVVVSELELTETMVKALDLLDQAGALMKEQVGVDRGPGRRLHVEGVVDSDARRSELTAILRTLPPRRVRVALVTVAEAARRAPSPPGQITGILRSADITQDREPLAFESVRHYLATSAAADLAPSGPPGQGDAGEAVRRLAAGLLSRSLQARLHGRAVRQLVAAVPASDADRLSPYARNAWRERVREHAEQLRDDTASLRRDLDRIFWPLGPNDAAVVEHPNDGDASRDGLAQMTERLFALLSRHDVTVREAFTIATNGSGSLDAASPAFRRSLLAAESLAIALIEAMSGAPSH